MMDNFMANVWSMILSTHRIVLGATSGAVIFSGDMIFGLPGPTYGNVDNNKQIKVTSLKIKF